VDKYKENVDHIGICICTYKRPQLLAELLRKLENQNVGGAFQYSVHVVDNDYRSSAEKTVSQFGCEAEVLVTYNIEPIQNIALARNRAVRCAQGNLIAFLDDDETPGEEWLLQMFLAFKKFAAAGVLGPVRPCFTSEAPAWLSKSGILNRPSYSTGTILTYLQARTGNLLFDRQIIRETDIPFPPETGRTGGEDTEFFKTMMARGHAFIWCEEAPVYETILPERFKRMYYVRQSLRIGGLSGERHEHQNGGKWRALLFSGCAALGHGFLSSVGVLLGQGVFMRHFTAMLYHLARITGWLGYPLIRERRD